MAKEKHSLSEMAHARRTSDVNVVFDKNSLATFHSRSSSNTSCENERSSDSGQHRRRYRSSSFSSSTSSSSSRSTSSRSRSRSRPRCHRRSSRCRCDRSFKSGLGRYPRSPPSRFRAHSRSHSRSPDRYSHLRRSRCHSKSIRRWSRYSRPASRSSRTYRSKSRSPGRSVSLSLHDKRELLEAAKVNAMRILGVENLELPESVKPILSEQSGSEQESPEPGTRVTQLPTKSYSQNNEEEPDCVPSPKLSLRGKISFSINNSVVKPTTVVPSCSKVTQRVDSFESRKPYGYWVPVKIRQNIKCKPTFN